MAFAYGIYGMYLFYLLSSAKAAISGTFYPVRTHVKWPLSVG